MITGESIPVDMKTGDGVIGATVNKQGLLIIKATKVGAETALSEMVHIVEEAQSTGHIQRLVDSVSAKFVPAVVSVSVASFLRTKPLRSYYISRTSGLCVCVHCNTVQFR